MMTAAKLSSRSMSKVQLMNFNTFPTINLMVAMFPQHFVTGPPFPSMMMILWDTIDACMFWSKFLA